MKLWNENQSKKFEVSFDKLDIFDRLLSEKFRSTHENQKSIVHRSWFRFECSFEYYSMWIMQKNGFFLKTYFITYIAQSERDEYERKYKEAETNLATLNATLKVVNKERDEIARDLSQYKQEILLLKQDKDYLYKQYIDVQNKYTLNESKIENLHVQLEDMKKSREEIYEKYINSK